MTDTRKRPGVGFWAAVAVAVVLAYPLLLGPCCWLSSRLDSGAGLVSVIYRPAIRILFRARNPTVMQTAITWYAEVGAAAGWNWTPGMTIHFGHAPEVEFNWGRKL